MLPDEFDKLWHDFRYSSAARRGWSQIEIAKRFAEFREWISDQFEDDDDDDSIELPVINSTEKQDEEELSLQDIKPGLKHGHNYLKTHIKSKE